VAVIALPAPSTCGEGLIQPEVDYGLRRNIEMIATRQRLRACAGGATCQGADRRTLAASSKGADDRPKYRATADEFAGSLIRADAAAPRPFVSVRIDHVAASGDRDRFEIHRHLMFTGAVRDQLGAGTAGNDQTAFRRVDVFGDASWIDSAFGI